MSPIRGSRRPARDTVSGVVNQSGQDCAAQPGEHVALAGSIGVGRRRGPPSDDRPGHSGTAAATTDRVATATAGRPPLCRRRCADRCRLCSNSVVSNQVGNAVDRWLGPKKRACPLASRSRNGTSPTSQRCICAVSACRVRSTSRPWSSLQTVIPGRSMSSQPWAPPPRSARRARRCEPRAAWRGSPPDGSARSASGRRSPPPSGRRTSIRRPRPPWPTRPGSGPGRRRSTRSRPGGLGGRPRGSPVRAAPARGVVAPEGFGSLGGFPGGSR